MLVARLARAASLAAVLRASPPSEALGEASPRSSRLDALYDGLPDAHDVPENEVRAIDESGGHEAYGELTPRGVRAVMGMLGANQGDVLADLGSGCGRMVLQCAMDWPFLGGVVGVELSSSRHQVAEQALSRLADWCGPQIVEKVRLYHADMLSPQLAPMLDDVTHVYVASLLFDDAFMARLGSMLASQPKIQAVATLSRFPPGSLLGFEESGEDLIEHL
ncbi:MAG: hypothetical protein SGPRY_009111, partial [Prymnesium sp.]